MIDTIALKQTILDFATSGKLSGSFNCLDSIEDIVSSIPVASNKRKKLLQQEFDYETPYAIPEHWQWLKLGEISSYGDTPKKMLASEADSDVWLLELEDIEAGGRLLKKRRISESSSIGEKTHFRNGQILYSKLRPYLKKVLIADEDGICTPEMIAFDVIGGISAKYILYCLLNSYTDRVIDKRSYGIKMPRVDAGFMVNLPIPVPPLSEQIFIVDKVDEILSVIKKIASFQDEYRNNLEVLVNKIIDAAIQGGLTEQLPEDGTAEELYKQIQKETQILIKEGRFKKKKALPDLNDDDYPFDIPKTWKWIHLGDLISIESGKGLTAAEMIPGDVPVYGGNGITGYHDNGFVPEGTVVIGRVGYYCGSVHVTQTVSWVTDNAFITAYPENSVDKWYLVYVLRKMRLGQNNNGSAQPVVSGKKIYPLAFPLPPLAEQKRIANIFKTIIPLCENVK